MIITSLKGGLGNQLFQYAVGRTLANKLSVPLKFDVMWFQKSQNRKYLLDKFNVNGEIATQNEIEKIKSDGFLSKFFGNKNICIEPKYKYYPEVLTRPDNTYIDGDGNWQSYKYFENIREIILKEVTLKNPLSKKGELLVRQIDETNSVSVHIRRTDYLAPKNLKLIGLCTPEYYEKAVTHIKQNLSNPKFIVFSDDLEWAKTLPFESNTIYVDSNFGLKDYEEMVVMSNCKHHILANSTFSWWAAWLNRNPNKIVITPKQWFIERSSIDLIPPSWEKI